MTHDLSDESFFLAQLRGRTERVRGYLVAVCETWLRLPRWSYAASTIMQERREARTTEEYWDKRWGDVHAEQDRFNRTNLIRNGVPYLAPTAKIKKKRKKARVKSNVQPIRGRAGK